MGDYQGTNGWGYVGGDWRLATGDRSFEQNSIHSIFLFFPCVSLRPLRLLR
jgi:hypothetical protein